MRSGTAIVLALVGLWLLPSAAGAHPAVVELHSPGADLSCFPEGDNAVARVRAYLARTAPAVRKRVFFDDDCDPQLISARHRADLVVALHAVARLRAG